MASYEIAWHEETIAHFASIDRKHHALIRDEVARRLAHEPLVEARSRKPLERPGPFGEETWELRLGPSNGFRVFYKVDQEARIVRIVAVGAKERERLIIGGEEIDT